MSKTTDLVIDEMNKQYTEQSAENYNNVTSYVDIAYCPECGATDTEEAIGKICNNCEEDEMIMAKYKANGTNF